MRISREFLFLPMRTMSSAKNKDEILRVPRSIPRPEELSSWPRLLINRQNRSGDKLQPEIDLLVMLEFA